MPKVQYCEEVSERHFQAEKSQFLLEILLYVLL